MAKKSSTKHKHKKDHKKTAKAHTVHTRVTATSVKEAALSAEKAKAPQTMHEAAAVSTPKSTHSRPQITANQYNDPKHNYLHYWDGRDYENQAEIVAIKRLLKGKHFRKAVDIGGGYGRLCVLLEEYADRVTLAEPSQQQLDIAEDYLKDHPRVDQRLMQVEHLDFKDSSVDLFTMIRVMHHLPDPQIPFQELSRALSKDGYIILEMANYTHFRNRVKHILKGQRFPDEPVDIRSNEHRSKTEIPFVNHNPRTVIKQLAHVGLTVERTLSVSNLRSPGLKKVLPQPLMVNLEKILQKPLATTYFGPSIFFLIRKAS
jgi:SAM-dependent methyltransferase